ncbi:2-methoxy-6-polyprenyl-1,4-benzoquinol methylase, mitochondrial [Candidatus Lokiarchaeum ossiferum]
MERKPQKKYNQGKKLEKTKKQKMKDRYNSLSYVETYDRRYYNLQFEKFNNLTQEYPIRGENILDFGAGTGLLWDFLQNNNYQQHHISQSPNPIRIVGIDLSRSMLNRFYHKIENHLTSSESIVKGTHLICCDGENLPFRSACFSNVFALTTLQNLPHLAQGLKEMQRISKNNGIQRISYLRKSIEKEELEHHLSAKFEEVQEIKPHSPEKIEYSEDWLFIAKKKE